jgi:hypothetical protein
MGQTIKILTHIHAGFGGIALLAGLVSMIAKKRLELHKNLELYFIIQC